VAALAGCGSSGDHRESASSPAARAAPFVRGASAGVGFVNWAALKKQLGASNLSVRLRRISDVAPLYSPSLQTGAKLVGFGPSDLDWEAQVQTDGPPLSLLGFPDGFDLGKVKDALGKCGYEKSEVDGGSLYTKPIAVSCAGKPDSFGTRTPPPTLASVAVLDDDKLLVGAASPATVRAAVKGRHDDAFKSKVDDLGSALDGVVAGYVGSGRFGCKQFSPGGPTVTPQVAAELKRRLGDLGKPYDLLLVGFVAAANRLDGRIALDYGDEGDARAGLKARRDAFEEAPSPATNRRLSDTLRLTSAKADGDALVFSLAPRGDAPLSLNAPVARRDLLFAGC
jgi:hypothetical protein